MTYQEFSLQFCCTNISLMLQALIVDIFLCKSLFSFLLTWAHIPKFNESYHSFFWCICLLTYQTRTYTVFCLLHVVSIIQLFSVQMCFVVLQCHVQYNCKFHKIHGNLNEHVTLSFFLAQWHLCNAIIHCCIKENALFYSLSF